MGDEVDFEDAVIASLARTEVHLGNIKEDVKEIKRTLHGNGREGVVVKTATQQIELDALREDVVELQQRPEPSDKSSRNPATMLGQSIITVVGFIVAWLAGIPRPI